MKITPQDPYLFLARAAALVKLERHTEALADREPAVRLAPEMAETYLARGGFLSPVGDACEGTGDRSTDYVKSRDDLAQAVLLRPDYREALDVLAKAEDRLAEAKAAEAKLTEATDANAAAPPEEAQAIPAAVAAAAPSASPPALIRAVAPVR